MTPDQFMNCASDLRRELRGIVADRDDKKSVTKSKTSLCNKAKNRIDECGDDFADDPLGSGMSSLAVSATNELRLEIRSSFISLAVDPAKSSITEISNSLREL